jgi:hypothetical protein
MNLVVTLYVAVLFMVLTPGVLLTLPKGGSKLVVAAVHGLVFAVVYHFTHKAVWRASLSLDGFQNNNNMNAGMNAGMNANANANAKKDGFKA